MDSNANSLSHSLQMPIMDGIESTRAIRAVEAQRMQQKQSPRSPIDNNNPRSPIIHTPPPEIASSPTANALTVSLPPTHGRSYIVAVTAISGDKERREAEKAGVDRFMVKPVKMGWLKEMIQAREKAKGEKL